MTQDNNRHNNFIMFLLTISIILLFLVVMRTPQGFYSDTAYQFKALQQYIQGLSPSFNHLVMPDKDDLSQDVVSWIMWWPPGPQLLTYPLAAKGMAVGDAVRIIVMICLIVGSIGWVRWFLLFELPLWVKVIFAIAMPWMHYSTNNLFGFSAEIFVYGVTPWILLATNAMSQSWAVKDDSKMRLLFLSIPFGFSLGAVYLFKYSGIFVSCGALVYIALLTYHRYRDQGKSLNKYRIVSSFILITAFFAIPIIALNLINQRLYGTSNPITAGLQLNLAWQNFLFLLADPPLAMTDGFSLLRYLIQNQDYGIGKNWPQPPCSHGEGFMWNGLVGLPGGLVLLWLIFLKNNFKGPKKLALTVFLTTIGLMFFIWCSTYRVMSYNANYIAAGCIAIVPFVIQQGLHLWTKGHRRAIRFILAAAGIGYIVIPLLYGGVAVVVKVFRAPKHYAVGPSRIYNSLLSDVDIASAADVFAKDFSPHKDIWYFSSPVTALDFTGRAIIIPADFVDEVTLSKERYVTKSTARIYALLPQHFEENGKGQVIRNSFIQAGSWERKKIKNCKCNLWTTTLKVAGNDE